MYISGKGIPIHASNTGDGSVWRENKDKGYTIMQDDGNLVIYVNENNAERALWSPNTWGNPGAYLVLEDDGRVVIYKKDSNEVLWHWE